MHHVPSEEQRHRPVGEDPRLAVGGRHPQDVVAAVQEPGREPPQADPEDPRDSLVQAQGGQTSEGPVAVGDERPAPRRGGDVSCQPLRLAQCVLRAGRRKPSRDDIGDRGAVAGRPGPLGAAYAQELVDVDPTPLVHR